MWLLAVHFLGDGVSVDDDDALPPLANLFWPADKIASLRAREMEVFCRERHRLLAESSTAYLSSP